MTDRITFRIDGEPVAQGRPRFTRSGHAYDPAKSREYKELVGIKAGVAMAGRELLPKGTPVWCAITVFHKIPRRFTKAERAEANAQRLLPTKKPDVDNIIKAIMDAMTGIVYEDDAQVATIVCRRFYSDEAMTMVSVGTR